ncbi:MAG: hypothetical protein WBM69_18525 [Desulfobacterales bacterium]
MAFSAMIKIGANTIKSSKQEVKFLKAILDKLEYPYILDGISFHNSLIDLNRMKTIHNTNVWKVEADGSVSLKNRFGHSGRFDFRYLRMPNLIEFQFVDFNILTDEENDFLGYLMYEAETIPAVSEQFI